MVIIGLLVHGMDYFLFAYFLKHEAYYVSEYKIFHFWPFKQSNVILPFLMNSDFFWSMNSFGTRERLDILFCFMFLKTQWSAIFSVTSGLRDLPRNLETFSTDPFRSWQRFVWSHVRNHEALYMDFNILHQQKKNKKRMKIIWNPPWVDRFLLMWIVSDLAACLFVYLMCFLRNEKSKFCWRI